MDKMKSPTEEEKEKLYGCVIDQCMSGLTYRITSPVSFEVICHGGFINQSFDARASLTPWSLLKLEELSRTVSYWNKTSDGQCFMDINNLGRAMYTVAVAMEIQEQVYDSSLEKRPIVNKTHMAHMGRTSIKYNCDMMFPDFSQPLVHVETQVVLYDLQSKRPSPPDDWWKEKYSGFASDKELPLRIAALQLPESGEIVEKTFTALPSDLDPYYHMNWTNYLRYCFDVYYLNQINLLGNKDPLLRNVKRVEVNYKKEILAGDEIVFKMWEKVGDSDTFCFLMFKDSTVVSECTIKFFPVSDQ